MKGKNICLITPPSPFLLDERVFMHIGLLKVAAVLEEQGYEVNFLDLSGIANYLDVLDDYLALKGHSMVFGVTATTPQVPYAVKIGKHMREKADKLILGGPHVTLMNAASKKEKRNNLIGSNRATRDMEQLSEIFDVLVCGDGELAIFDALKLDKGIIDADDRKSPLFLRNKTLTDLPLPARHLVDVDSYKYFIEGERSISLIAQLGCPFQCTFCSGRSSPFLRNIRTRTIQSIVDEIEHLHIKYGMKGFMLYDDELNVNKEMIPLMKEIKNLQRKHQTEFKLRGFIKAELFNEEQAMAMYDAGFRWLLTGFESGDETILKNIRKNATRDDNTKCVEVGRKHGLKVKALMSIGHAGESPETINNTKKWLLETKPDDFDCTIITTYPGSPYFDDAVFNGEHYIYTDPRSGDRLHQAQLDYCVDQDYYKGAPDGGYVSYGWTDYITAGNLVKEREKLEQEVRRELGIPYNPGRPGITHEHSMGMGNIEIPDYILRSSTYKNRLKKSTG